MSYVKVSKNGDFILYTDDNLLLVIGNRISDYSMQYRITISNSVFFSSSYSNIVKDFFTEYFTENALFEFTRCISNKCYDCYDFYDCDFTAVLVKSFWNRMETYSVDETLKIIDDALCHGFEFKVENGNVYFREIMNKI